MGMDEVADGSCQSVSRLLGAASRLGDVNGDADEGLTIVSDMTRVVLAGMLCTRRVGVNLSGSMTLAERTGNLYELEIERRTGPYLRINVCLNKIKKGLRRLGYACRI